MVAQLLTPEPDHRLLLLAPALRLHNQTVGTSGLFGFRNNFSRSLCSLLHANLTQDMVLQIRFHAEDARAAAASLQLLYLLVHISAAYSTAS